MVVHDGTRSVVRGARRGRRTDPRGAGAGPDAAGAERPADRLARHRSRRRLARPRGDICMSIDTIKLPERMDSTSAHQAEEMLRAAMQPGARIIVDGSAVTYMS